MKYYKIKGYSTIEQKEVTELIAFPNKTVELEIKNIKDKLDNTKEIDIKEISKEKYKEEIITKEEEKGDRYFKISADSSYDRRASVEYVRVSSDRFSCKKELENILDVIKDDILYSLREEVIDWVHFPDSEEELLEMGIDDCTLDSYNEELADDIWNSCEVEAEEITATEYFDSINTELISHEVLCLLRKIEYNKSLIAEYQNTIRRTENQASELLDRIRKGEKWLK